MFFLAFPVFHLAFPVLPLAFPVFPLVFLVFPLAFQAFFPGMTWQWHSAIGAPSVSPSVPHFGRAWLLPRAMTFVLQMVIPLHASWCLPRCSLFLVSSGYVDSHSGFSFWIGATTTAASQGLLDDLNRSLFSGLVTLICYICTSARF